VEAWVYPTVTQTSWRAIVQKETDAWFMHASSDAGTLFPAAGGTYGVVGGVTMASSPIPVNAWSHLAQTYDGATLRLYVNGVLASSHAQTGALEANNTPMWIGSNTYNESFQGRIDDVRIYDHALSIGELATDMNTPVGAPSGPDTTPPSAPGTLTASAVSATQINLSWGAATDNVGVTGYRVERCSGAGCTTFTQIATPTGTSFSDTGLTALTSYSYRVRAVDAAANPGPLSNTSSATTSAAPDTTPPSAPGTLTASAASATQINLSWGAATDNVGVTSYQVERCSGAGCTTFSPIATPTGTNFNDAGLSASTSHSYRVRAVDAAGNPGPFSNTSSATTQAAPDTTPPSAPGTLTASAVSATQINLSWGAATDNVGVTGYQVERCSGSGCTTFSPIATPTGTSFNDTGLTASTSYSYRVRAVDAAANPGPFSNTSTATTQAAPDTTPPSAPGALTASATSATQINLSWGAATDNVGVTGYRVERCSGAGCTTFSQIATPTGTSFSDTGLTDSTSYSYRVRAVDAASNPGAFSSTSSATTPDTTPPSAPGALTASATSPTQINLSWGAATDNVSVSGYRVERCIGAGCTSFAQIAGITGTTFNDPGLTASTSYSYRVRAVDAAGNPGPFSNTSTATTPAAPDTTPPSAPGALTASATSATQINLSWGAATDNVGVTGYRVERCSGAGCTTFTQIATPTGTSFSDTGLTALTSYSYRVRAVDAAANPGPFSNTSTAATLAGADTTPPSAPGTLTASATSATQINLSWGAATDNLAVTGYQVERCAGAGCTTFTQIATPTGTSFNDTGLTASTSYSYRVRAVDAAANPGPFSNTSSATTQAAPDTTPPSAPGTLTASATSATQINLSWGAATDNLAVTGYQVERCAGAGCTTFSPIAAPTGTSFNDTGLTASTSYSYRVRAVDAAANPGAFSNTSSATTSAQTVIPGLVAAYSFDEGAGATLVDRAGNTNTGTIEGTAGWTTQGKNSGALTFDGFSTRVSVPSSASLNVTNGLTVEAWVYPTVTQTSWRAIVQKETDAWFMHASSDAGTLFPTVGGTYAGNMAVTQASAAIAVNTWSHLALTYDGATLRLYVNGVLASSRAQTGALEANNTPMWIGSNTYNESFEGRIDDVRVYDHALSASELASDMNTPVGP
jgi:fibronectin type 3 domain-containing protein